MYVKLIIIQVYVWKPLRRSKVKPLFDLKCNHSTPIFDGGLMLAPLILSRTRERIQKPNRSFKFISIWEIHFIALSLCIRTHANFTDRIFIVRTLRFTSMWRRRHHQYIVRISFLYVCVCCV